MKQIEGFKLRKLVNEFIVTGEGSAQVNFNRIISLNESAAYLWRAVEGREFTVEDLTKLLLDEYEVDEATAARDARALADKWVDVGIVER